MGVAYFKRFRMEIDLERLPAVDPLPEDCQWMAWQSHILGSHALVKFRCFQSELDAQLFPCLSDRGGCAQLMRDIANRRGFVPQATWLVVREDQLIGTVQGVIERAGLGMIQNLGVVPEARNLGIGTNLLLQSLHGFRSVGLTRGMLEVTAHNTGAVRLYRRLGFHKARTLYRALPALADR